MIKFCHISPTPYLEEYTKTNGAHLILAHLVEEDEKYRNFYANLNDGKPKILDNSGFENYKRGLPMMDPDKLIALGKAVNADYIVMSDYPNEPGQKTIDAAVKLIPEFKAAGFKTFFVPQSRIGDLEDYICTLEWAIANKNIDLIGISILGVPNAFGVERGNKLQRYLSRKHLMDTLRERGILDKNYQNRLHFLGMVDGPREISLVKDYHRYIFSWDSSSAVWAGMNGIKYDNSPTGLIDGKFEVEVDFDADFEHDKDLVEYNQMIINSQLRPF